MRMGGVLIAGLIGLTCALGGLAVGAEEEAPSDPTRGRWDSFLDPLRDFEDKYITSPQKEIEDKSKVHLGAGIQKAWTWSFNHPPSGSNLPYDLFDTQNSSSIDIGQIRANRPSEGWFVPGFGVTLTFGKTARRIKADWDGDGTVDRGDIFETSNFDAEEAYLTWTVPEDAPLLKGLTVKGGKFVTLLGAEVIEPWANFNQSHSLLFAYAIPFTHTGVLLSYPLTEKIAVTGGPIVGWDNVTTNNNGWNGIGNITWSATDQLTLAANLIGGPTQNDNVGNKRVVVDLVSTIKPTDKLTVYLNYDWGHEDEAGLAGNGAIWQGLAAAATYNVTDRFTAAGRIEFFNDFDGARTGIGQRVWEYTLTWKYLITQHFYTQLELREDFSTEDAFQKGDSDLRDTNPLVSISWTYLFL